MTTWPTKHDSVKKERKKEQTSTQRYTCVLHFLSLFQHFLSAKKLGAYIPFTFYKSGISIVTMNYSSITLNSGPVFRRSTFRNEDVLILESSSDIPLIRIMMIVICLILGFCTFINLVVNYLKHRVILKHTILCTTVIPMILLLNIIFHVSHYAHNIYDPAAYFEPKKLYIKVVITEMEQTFIFNFPLSILFIVASRKLLVASTVGHFKSINMPIMVTLYSLMSMVSGGHYTYEPPSHFSFICNMTVAGETVIAFLLLIISLFVHRSNLSKPMFRAYSRLGTDENSNMPTSNVQQRQLKHKTHAKISTDDDSS